MTPDIYVRIVDNMPVNEFVAPSGPFSYSVYISSSLSPSGRQKALRHALRHIQNNDFDRTDVQTIESEAHR